MVDPFTLFRGFPSCSNYLHNSQILSTHAASATVDGCTSSLMSRIDIYITVRWHLLRADAGIPSLRLWLRVPAGDGVRQCKYEHLRSTTHYVPADSCVPVRVPACTQKMRWKHGFFFSFIYNDILQVGTSELHLDASGVVNVKMSKRRSKISRSTDAEQQSQLGLQTWPSCYQSIPTQAKHISIFAFRQKVIKITICQGHYTCF